MGSEIGSRRFIFCPTQGVHVMFMQKCCRLREGGRSKRKMDHTCSSSVRWCNLCLVSDDLDTPRSVLTFNPPLPLTVVLILFLIAYLW
jgi:hypothetical protein